MKEQHNKEANCYLGLYFFISETICLVFDIISATTESNFQFLWLDAVVTLCAIALGSYLIKKHPTYFKYMLLVFLLQTNSWFFQVKLPIINQADQSVKA